MDTTRKGCLLNVLLAGFGTILGIGLTAVAAVILFLPSTTTVATDLATGSATGSATDEGPPNVYFKERSRLLGSTDHEVWIGRSEDYGHVVTVPGGWDTTPEVVRTEEGVELRFGDDGGSIGGGRIFVPEEAYAGGR